MLQPVDWAREPESSLIATAGAKRLLRSIIDAMISAASRFKSQAKHEIREHTTEIWLTDASIHGHNAVATIAMILARVRARGTLIQLPSRSKLLPHAHSFPTVKSCYCPSEASIAFAALDFHLFLTFSFSFSSIAFLSSFHSLC